MANLFTAEFADRVTRTLEAYGFEVLDNGNTLTARSRGGTPLYLHIIEDPGGRQFLRWTATDSPTSTTLAEFDEQTLRAWLFNTYYPQH